MPTVSVIMVTWNQGDYLLEAAGSILDQSMPDLELVLVDNHSTDGSVDRLLALRPDRRIRLVRHDDNLGIARGLNAAVAQCTAPWIAVMDADDRSHPLRLELQLRGCAADPSLDLVATGVHWIDAQGRTTGTYRSFHEPDEIRASAPYHMPVLHPSLLGRAEVFRRIPYRAACRYACDFDWFLRVIEQYRVGSVSLPLFFYRAHAGSTTLAHAKASQASACAIRLLRARRAAGREELLEATMAEADRLGDGPGTMASIHQQFARRMLAEGFAVPAAFQAALAVRSAPGAGRYLTYLRTLFAAWRADPQALGPTFASLGRLPFWVLLQRAGFPPFPRY